MISSTFRAAVFTAAALTAAALAGGASAKGCNGYVNQLVWGCAPWDNNNGPQYPHYVKPAAPATAAMVIHSAAAPTAPAPKAAANVRLPASGIVAQGGGNLGPTSGGGIVAQGGGNFGPGKN